MRYLAIFYIFVSLISFSAKKEFIPIFSKEDEVKNISYVYELSNKIASSLVDPLNIYKEAKIKAYENKLLIYGPKNMVDDLVSLIKKFDTTKEQVFIKIKILDITKDLVDRLGLNWNKDKNISLIDFLTNDSENKFKKFKDRGDIRIKLMPSILVLDNEKASFKISTLNVKLKPSIKKKKFKKYVELSVEIKFNDKEFIKTIINIDDKKSAFVSSNNFSEKSSFSYLSSKNKTREVYIEIELVIL